MRRMITLALSALSLLPASSQKVVFIPSEFNASWSVDYCNKNGKNGTINSIEDLKDTTERWCQARSYATDNVVCFWEKGFGNDPKNMKSTYSWMANFDLTERMKQCEEIINYHMNTLKAAYPDGYNFKKYKFMFMLNYKSDWLATGSGYDTTCGAMWLDPWAMSSNTTLAHELFHSMSFMCKADRPDDEHNGCDDTYNGPFWERSANNASALLYPSQDLTWERFSYAPYSQYLSTRKQYAPSFMLENLRDSFGITSLGRIWRSNLKDEHVINTISREFFGGNLALFEDFVCQTAQKMCTFDFLTGSNALYYRDKVASMGSDWNGTGSIDGYKLYQKYPRTLLYAVDADSLHFAVRDCQAPQDLGYNRVQLFPQSYDETDSATVYLHFKGHDAVDNNKNPGWRWAFVAVPSGTKIPRYGNIHRESDGQTALRVAKNETLWLVVVGTPTAITSPHYYVWDCGWVKSYRYPWEIALKNAVPMGYNDDYEGTKTNGHTHLNGGGFVANTATVASTAYVGPHAKVLGYATVSDSARIKDYAIVKGGAKISGNAEVNENAMVLSNAQVTDNAVVSGEARVFNGSVISGDAFVTDNAFIDATKVYGNAICCGNLWQRDYSSYEVGGTAVCGGDMEKAGYITTGKTALTAGTYLQEPNSEKNGRSYADGLGNMGTLRLKNLKQKWNILSYRYSAFNGSLAGNKDVNNAYDYFANADLSIDTVGTPIENGFSYHLIEKPLEEGQYYIMNLADGTVLTYTGSLSPQFQSLDEDNDTNAVWTMTKLNSGYCKLFCGASAKYYLNYNGQLSLYTMSNNTFYVYRRSDQQAYAVKNRNNSLYWSVSGNTVKGTTSSINGFPVRFIKKSGTSTEMEEISKASGDQPVRTEYYTIDGIRQQRLQQGLNIIRKVYRDGHEESVKVNL